MVYWPVPFSYALLTSFFGSIWFSACLSDLSWWMMHVKTYKRRFFLSYYKVNGRLFVTMHSHVVICQCSTSMCACYDGHPYWRRLMNLMLTLLCLYEVWFISEQSAAFSIVVLTECHCCMQGLYRSLAWIRCSFLNPPSVAVDGSMT